jgi:hypothetical protein
MAGSWPRRYQSAAPMRPSARHHPRIHSSVRGMIGVAEGGSATGELLVAAKFDVVELTTQLAQLGALPGDLLAE